MGLCNDCHNPITEETCLMPFSRNGKTWQRKRCRMCEARFQLDNRLAKGGRRRQTTRKTLQSQVKDVVGRGLCTHCHSPFSDSVKRLARPDGFQNRQCESCWKRHVSDRGNPTDERRRASAFYTARPFVPRPRERNSERDKKQFAYNSLLASDSYTRSLLKGHLRFETVPVGGIPAELIELKSLHLQLERKIAAWQSPHQKTKFLSTSTVFVNA